MSPRTLSIFLICCWTIISGISGMLLFSVFKPNEGNEEKGGFCGNAFQGNKNKGGPEETKIFFDGQALFKNNCASCHNPIKDATGPALAYMQSYRSQEWICRFLTDPGFHPSDKRARALSKQYRDACFKFPRLSCTEVEAIFTYINH